MKKRAHRPPSLVALQISCRVLLLCCLLKCLSPTLYAADGEERVIADRGIELIDSEGALASPLNAHRDETTVIVFLGVDCPVANLFVPELNRLHQQWKERHVTLIGVYANRGVDLEQVQLHVANFDVRFPVYFDPKQALVNNLGVTRTPEAVVLDSTGELRYRGRIDNRLGYTYKREEPQRADLALAVADVIGERTVEVARTETVGCLITPIPAVESDVTTVSYAGEIALLIEKNCQECHHPGTAAPFSLMSYDDVLNHSQMIKEVVVEQRMPPWHADPAHGEFSNDLRMPQEEIDRLVSWIDQGAPLGDREALPEPKVYADGWMIGEPEEILEMPQEYQVQAEGVVEYQYFRMSNPFSEDIWVQAAEARPGNRSVVHHIILYYLQVDSEGKERPIAIAGTAPGEEPMILPEGMGLRIPAGADLMWEMHYTPVGREKTDRSQVGLILCKERPEREVYIDAVANRSFEIEPFDAAYEVTARKTLSRDVDLITLMPHMHLRGKSFEFKAIDPQGAEEILLSVPQYDFNWQHTYRLTEPKRLPAGTVIECRAVFDNSADNPANPAPEETVRWGDQTFEEMMIGFLGCVTIIDE